MTDLVIFDCDGVLVDSERLTTRIEARVLTELGWPVSVEEVVARWMGGTSHAQLRDVADRLGAEAATAFDEQTSRELRTAFETELTAVEGVVGLLDHLDATGVATCVASSGTHAKMGLTLGVTGLAERFAGRIHSGTEVARGKPAPDLFVHAAGRMGVDPSRCTVVEDSVLGVRAGVAAGMTVYGFGGGLSSTDALEEAGAIVFEEMSDLVPLLTHSS